jgi:uncharacterized protein
VCPLRVTDLATYPVKSCAGIHLQEARITPRGLELDRDFMLIDDDGDFVSQRKVPALALIVPTVGAGSITLAAPGMENAELPLQIDPDDNRLLTATVHGRPVMGQIVGEDLNEWFTTFLPAWKGNRCFRLLHVREDVPRYIKSRYQEPGASNLLGFADANSMLLASEASLAKLNDELEQPVPMNRFRPNIVVDGDDLAPYDEDYWIKLEIGCLTAFVVKACDRCVIPDVDQLTAVTGKAVRRALRTRKGVNAYDHSQQGVFFAQNLNHVYEPGVKVSVGDPVRVIERGTDPNVLLDAAKLNVA